MRHTKFNFLFTVGLVLAFALSAFTFEGGDKNKSKTKPPKNTGILSVRTTPGAYQVRIDGQVVGMSGVSTGAEFYLAPGLHRVEVEGPNGKTFSRDIEVSRDTRNCICLKVVETINTRACPYDVRVDAPDKVLENDLITFSARNQKEATVPINYKWTSNAPITSGQGTPAVTVDSKGFGGTPITATLDVTDDVFGATCFQSNSVETNVEKQIVPQAQRCDIFESQSFDDDKARFDNCTVQLQAEPDSQIYIILYQGAGKNSQNVDKLGRRTLDYLVKTRGIDPRRIQIVKSGTRPRTSYEIYIIPPGAMPPVPQ